MFHRKGLAVENERSGERVPGKISDLMPALGNWSLSVFFFLLRCRDPQDSPVQAEKEARGAESHGPERPSAGVPAGREGRCRGRGGRRGPARARPGRPLRHPTSRADGRAGRRRPAASAPASRLPARWWARRPAVLLPPLPVPSGPANRRETGAPPMFCRQPRAWRSSAVQDLVRWAARPGGSVGGSL